MEAREKVVEMRKKGIPIPLDLQEAAKMAKVKEFSSPASAQSTPSKKGKTPLSNKEKRQKEKAKRERELEEDPTAPKKKKKKTETKKKEPVNKAFVQDVCVPSIFLLSLSPLYPSPSSPLLLIPSPSFSLFIFIHGLH